MQHVRHGPARGADPHVVGLLRHPLDIAHKPLAEEPHAHVTVGMLISNGVKYMMSGRYWISVYPGIALIILIVAINLVGDHVRDILNPRLNR